MIKKYLLLTKPGIIIGNLITAAAGFFLASKGNINWVVFIGLLIGITCIIGASCVVNNYLDRDIDRKMERTKRRPSVTGSIPLVHGLIYAAILGVVGFIVLNSFTNLLTVFVGFIGVLFYVVIYSIWKRKSIYSTLIGSVSGAVPPVAGYTAVTNHFDLGALLLFLFLTVWQMPHFYAIGIYRLKDYTTAGIPIFPVKKGIIETKIHIVIYITLFTIVGSLLTVFGYTGYIYLVAVIILGLRWLMIAIPGFRTKDNVTWAKQTFKFSLLVITILCIAMSIDFVR